ncbi:UDP-glucose 4-epimerase GalE [Anaerotalea alkaliphila]|uniref:UDP-glucose 4-epimerase n=1 Tax=Anaerotalea alkaliphila TaxID=2662126 RepID=A0A7X5HY29_9FIRM|nr:UDP-glucose 4-epimerase GalE [Anaerotalea alkaliphila]NDL68706.1 UDP-glucose 4-epimerase GalE [Anaerotalea alkaliphila]
MNILVTGGTGYIGSHTCVALLEAGHSVVVADNLVNSKIDALDRIKRITGKDILFHEIDVTCEESVEGLFSSHLIDGVIHFAGLKAVGESIQKPLEYYYNNVVSTIVLARACIGHGVHRFVFSSSATVYGENEVPFVETMPFMPTTNPYGETKVMNERILTDTAKANPGFSPTLLRYFNPVGAHESGLIGEDPNGIPNNLMPVITQAAKGKLQKLLVYGDDYPTDDGTGVRDYIHVVDLAEGHVAAIAKPMEGVRIYNLGTGQGTSVLELVKAFEEVNGIKVPYEIVGRRPGDIPSCYADVSKAERELGWKARFGIKEMVRDAWRFENNSAGKSGMSG